MKGNKLAGKFQTIFYPGKAAVETRQNVARPASALFAARHPDCEFRWFHPRLNLFFFPDGWKTFRSGHVLTPVCPSTAKPIVFRSGMCQKYSMNFINRLPTLVRPLVAPFRYLTFSLLAFFLGSNVEDEENGSLRSFKIWGRKIN